MTFFASREAMTTDEPPEPLTFQLSDFIDIIKIFRRLTARRRGIIRVDQCAFVVLKFKFG